MSDQTETFKTIILFHGMLLTVVTHENKDYIPLKPIVEMLGTQWKTAREKAVFGDNAELFGTCELEEPIFNRFNPPRGTKKAVHILLEAGETYLMKTNTNQIRAHGNESVANYLLNLQKEWRKALHDYETKGIAFKSSKGSDLVKLDKIKDPHIKAEFAKDINAQYGMDIPLGKQSKLNV